MQLIRPSLTQPTLQELAAAVRQLQDAGMASLLHPMGIGSRVKPATDAPSTWPLGHYSSRVYGGVALGYPSDFGTLLTTRGTDLNAATQIYVSWPSSDGGASRLWVRGCRDVGTDVWGPWATW